MAERLKNFGEKASKDFNKQLEEQRQKEEKAKWEALLQQQNKK